MLLPFYQKKLIEAGCDEAGRGCYAGPVFAAAVILPKKFNNKWINDSKKLTAAQRNDLKLVIESAAICFAVAQVSEEKIDATNILKASIKAMHLAIEKLATAPQLLIIDGNRFHPYKNIPHLTIIKGDGLYTSIAAASILAKTYRDNYMETLHHSFPHYNWLNNKGYGTLEHRKAIEKHGLCIHHRKSFNIAPIQGVLF
jgi:ribonuclease HII